MEKPPKLPDGDTDYEEVIEIIQEATNGIDFGAEFMTELLLFFRENVRDVFSGQTTFFILGSYSKHPIRRLHFTERKLNSRHNTYAFVLCDLFSPDELSEFFKGQCEENSPFDTDSHSEADNRPQESFSSDESSEYSPPMTHCQFYLLATYTDYLVAIFEGRHAGPSVELSELRNNFFDKSYAFVRNYKNIEKGELNSGDKISPGIDITNAYSQPQQDIFALFRSEDRLYEWKKRFDLATKIEKLPKN